MEVKGRDLVAGVPKTVDDLRRGDPRRARRADQRRSSRRCASRSSARRPSSRPTSSTRASCSPAAARCCANLDVLLREETGLPVMVADDPLTAVVMGAGKALDEIKLLKDIAIQLSAHAPSGSERPCSSSSGETASSSSSGFFLLLLARRARRANARQPGRIDPLGRVFLEVMAPFQRVDRRRRAAASRGVWERYVALIGVQRENDALRERVRDLERRDARLERDRAENRRLQRLLALRSASCRPARSRRAVIGARRQRLVRRALTHQPGRARRHRERGMPVLAPEGVVGQVSSTSPHAARVLLLTDPQQRHRRRSCSARGSRGIVERAARAAAAPQVREAQRGRAGRRPRRRLGARRHLPEGPADRRSPRCRARTRARPLCRGTPTVASRLERCWSTCERRAATTACSWRRRARAARSDELGSRRRRRRAPRRRSDEPAAHAHAPRRARRRDPCRGIYVLPDASRCCCRRRSCTALTGGRVIPDLVLSCASTSGSTSTTSAARRARSCSATSSTASRAASLGLHAFAMTTVVLAWCILSRGGCGWTTRCSGMAMVFLGSL